MGCGSSSSPTAAEVPLSVDPVTTTAIPISIHNHSNVPINVIAAAVNGRSNPPRPTSVPLTKPSPYKHHTPLTMVRVDTLYSTAIWDYGVDDNDSDNTMRLLDFDSKKCADIILTLFQCYSDAILMVFLYYFNRVFILFRYYFDAILMLFWYCLWFIMDVIILFVVTGSRLRLCHCDEWQ